MGDMFKFFHVPHYLYTLHFDLGGLFFILFYFIVNQESESYRQDLFIINR